MCFHRVWGVWSRKKDDRGRDKAQRQVQKQILYSVDLNVQSCLRVKGKFKDYENNRRRWRETCVSGEWTSAAKELAKSPVDQRPSLSCYLSPSLLSTSPHIFFDSITNSPWVPVGKANQIFCIICWWWEWENFSWANIQTYISDIPEYVSPDSH